MKKYLSLLLLVWTGVILILYYVVQKPGLLGIFAGLLDTSWTILVAAILLFNAYGLGRRVLRLISTEIREPVEHLLLSWGIGLGAWGLVGLFLSMTRLANEILLMSVQLIVFTYLLIQQDGQRLFVDWRSLQSALRLSFSPCSYFTKFVIGLTLLCSFLLSLAPPFEAFDTLINHLAQPAILLRDDALRPVNILPFWYPTLTENVYLWGLAMGSERVSQIIHLAWGILAGLLLWHWSAKLWGNEVGRKTLLLLAAIPSLAMLASWAYADMALAFYAVAALYAIATARSTPTMQPVYLAAVLSGLAMGVKYQSFVIPLTCGLILLFHMRFSGALTAALHFSAVTLLIALPWYLRNAVYMGNPFYPFLFGGRYWDPFLAEWWTEPGSGIGWNVSQIVMLPLNVTLGHWDATFFDGRIGSLYLLLLPVTLWVLLSSAQEDSKRKASLAAIAIFTALSFGAWTLGVINTSALWQARYLLPAIMAFTIPTALAWDRMQQLDTPRFRVSFIANVVVGLVISLALLDLVIFVVQRNPLAVAMGVQSRAHYVERVNPSYAAAISMLNELPADAYIYNLFEPRSYGLPRTIQPDTINSNFAHDLHLYRGPGAILEQWQARGYTHILLYERGRSLLIDSGKFTPAMQSSLEDTLSQLVLIDQTHDQAYSLYSVPLDELRIEEPYDG